MCRRINAFTGLFQVRQYLPTDMEFHQLQTDREV